MEIGNCINKLKIPKVSSTIHIGSAGPAAKHSAKTTPAAGYGKAGLMQQINDYLAEFSKVKPSEKASFFRLLATMIDAGISIVKSLDILTEQMENPLLKKVIRAMVQDIESGSSFSEAASRHPKHFAAAEVGMLEAGEASGKLRDVLGEIAKQTEKSAAFISKIKSAMIYPAAIIVIMIIAGFAVMTLVMPKIKEIFEGLGGELPAITQALISTSDFLVASPLGLPNAVWALALMAGFVSALLWLKRSTRMGAYLWYRALFAMPVFGKLAKQAALARLCRSLSTLISSGIPIIKTLIITSDSIGNVIYKERIEQIAEDVKHGITMAENMQGDKKYFPSMMVGMIGVAEQTAQLDKISDRLANYYESEVDEMVKGLSSLIEPIIIVVLGVSVGLLVVAVMMPILSVSNLAL